MELEGSLPNSDAEQAIAHYLETGEVLQAVTDLNQIDNPQEREEGYAELSGIIARRRGIGRQALKDSRNRRQLRQSIRTRRQ